MDSPGTEEQFIHKITQLEKQHYDTIIKLIRHYENELKSAKEINPNNAEITREKVQEELNKLEYRLRNSLTWRVGCFFTYPWCLFNRVLHRIKRIPLFGSKKTNENVSELENNPDPLPAIKEEFPTSRKDLVSPSTINPGKLTVVGILDTFTKKCFEPEFNLICPTPKNWELVLNESQPAIVFVESAWHGNDNTWENLVSESPDSGKLKVLKDLTNRCNEKGIPTIFWNKEDPVHFNAFLETAGLFDVVFTSDADSVPRYVQNLHNEKVFPLPFAAQHKIHNPTGSGKRNKKVCFAGSYYNFSFAERKIDLDILLEPALDFGLDIYDRNFGVQGLAAEEYRFPEKYSTAIKGKLDYNEMLQAYREYQVFLNVNSVKYSPTMFARRVFELLACGTPVISNYSKGIVDLLGDDVVFVAESEGDTRRYLEQLLGDKLFWWKRSLAGMRKVLESHTYQDRAEEILFKSDIGYNKIKEPSFLVISQIDTPADLQYLNQILRNQNYPCAGVLFMIKKESKFSDRLHMDAISNSPSENTWVVNDEGIDLSQFIDLTFTHAAFVDENSYYGRNYLRDLALAVKYSDAKLFGKDLGLEVKEDGNLFFPDIINYYSWVDTVPSGTLVVDKNYLHEVSINEVMHNETFSSKGNNILTIDPFNYLNGGRKLFDFKRSTVISVIDI